MRAADFYVLVLRFNGGCVLDAFGRAGLCGDRLTKPVHSRLPSFGHGAGVTFSIV